MFSVSRRAELEKLIRKHRESFDQETVERWVADVKTYYQVLVSSNQIMRVLDSRKNEGIILFDDEEKEPWRFEIDSKLKLDLKGNYREGGLTVRLLSLDKKLNYEEMIIDNIGDNSAFFTKSSVETVLLKVGQRYHFDFRILTDKILIARVYRIPLVVDPENIRADTIGFLFLPKF